MAILDILPTTNIKVEDIRDTLRAGGGTVTNDALSFFTAEANINPWSKRKPVVAGDLFTDADDYWRCADRMCGFTPMRFSGIEQLPGLMDGGLNGWFYNLPTSTPKRLGDFRGYAYKAQPPVSTLTAPARAGRGTGEYFDVTCLGSQPLEGSAALSLADITPIANYKFGILMQRSGNVVTQQVVTGGSISNGGFTCRVSSQGLAIGTWTIYPFLAANDIIQREPLPNNTYYTLPCLNPITIQLVASISGVKIELTATYGRQGSDKSTITATYRIISNGGTVTLSNNAISARFFGNTAGSPFQDGEQQQTIPNITVAEGTPYSSSAIFTGCNTTRTYYIIITLNTAQYTALQSVLGGATPL